MNHKKNYFLFFILLFATFVSAAAQPMGFVRLSPQAKVSLITIGAGGLDDELYTTFGHTVLRVADPMQGIDRLYNYGTFDFRTEGFYLKFIKGTLPYTLSINNFQQTLDYYANRANRSVVEQMLDLSPLQKQRVFGLLEENYLPQNREYQYKFFYDNCASRPKDILLKACGDSLVLPTDQVLGGQKSFRQWMNSHLEGRYLERSAMNLAIGHPADEIATLQGAMYLPENVYTVVKNTHLKSGKPLVLGEIKHYTAVDLGVSDSLTMVYVALIILFVALMLLSYFRKHPLWLDKTMWMLNGIAGLILLLLWVATNHGVTNQNIGLFCCMPLNVAMAWFVGKPQYASWMRYYYLFFAGCLVAYILTSPAHSPTLIALYYFYRCIWWIRNS
jgi:Domain of unknown function (DUF4105)